MMKATTNTKKKDYVAPALQVMAMDTLDNVCGVVTGSKGTEDGGLAKDHTGDLWDEDDYEQDDYGFAR